MGALVGDMHCQRVRHHVTTRIPCSVDGELRRKFDTDPRCHEINVAVLRGGIVGQSQAVWSFHVGTEPPNGLVTSRAVVARVCFVLI